MRFRMDSGGVVHCEYEPMRLGNDWKAVLMNPYGEMMDVDASDVRMESAIGAPVEVSIKGYIKKHEIGFMKYSIPNSLKVKRVIWSYPATIVLWEDGTKTVVKCDERDKYDMKYGFLLCCLKKALGNTSRALNDMLDKWLEDREE